MVYWLFLSNNLRCVDSQITDTVLHYLIGLNLGWPYGQGLNYSKVNYSVDSLNLKHLCTRWSDSHGVFGIEFRTQKLSAKYESSQFFNSKTNGENPVKLGCIVLNKSAWKSVYRISDFTVSMHIP